MLDNHQEFVVATIVSRHGSTPRTAGTRMIIPGDGPPVGTIGGGILEARVVQKAGKVLKSKRPLLIRFDMTQAELSAMDMICGGQLEVLLEFIDSESPSATVFRKWREVLCGPERCLFLTVCRNTGDRVEDIHHCLLKSGRVVCGDLPFPRTTVENMIHEHGDAACLRTVTLGEFLILIEPVLPADIVFLFGAGHVAQSTARLSAFAGFRVRVVDDRAEFANAERFPDAEETRVVRDFDSAMEKMVPDAGSFIVIVTRGHLHDKTVLMHALQTEAGYIGMIGSRSKRDKIFDALLKQGFTKADLKRVYSPIGLDIGAETPEEIALSIVAELVQIRAQRRCA